MVGKIERLALSDKGEKLSVVPRVQVAHVKDPLVVPKIEKSRLWPPPGQNSKLIPTNKNLGSSRIQALI